MGEHLLRGPSAGGIVRLDPRRPLGPVAGETEGAGLLSDYFRGKNGKSREDLRGKTLTCSCRCGDKVLSKPDDIVWEIAD